MKLHETTKLHFGKYLYKLVLSNQLCFIFRSRAGNVTKFNKLGNAKSILDKLTERYMQNLSLEKQVYRTKLQVPVNDYLDAKDIYTLLKYEDDYTLRAELGNRLTVYCNDKELLDLMIAKMRVNITEFWEPAADNVNMLINQKNIIIVNSPPEFPIKITFGNQPTAPDFTNWLNANSDKSKIGPAAVRAIENKSKLGGLYFYVRNEKVLALVMILIGNNVRRVDNLVYKP